MLPQDENNPRKNEISDQNQRFKCVLVIKHAFWWPYYIKTLVLFCWIFGAKPCPIKLRKMMDKSIKQGSSELIKIKA